MQCIDNDGVVIHYESCGDAARPALVFSNSLGTDLRIWDRVAPAFEDSFFVIRYDKRGHGLSDAPPRPYRMDDHVADLIALMNACRVSEAIICGDSVGGLIAQAVAARDPARVRALVLCDTAAKIGDAPTWNTRIAAAEQGGVEALADGTMERWFTDGFRRDRSLE
ncbi:MAG: alpha/beta fold hydrolase, partial [Proteobacteria bacterium]